jgi:aryl-alcohol dehydrogenase-like predicted oxidoreductase
MLDNEYQRGNMLRTAKQRGKIIHARSIFLQGLFFMDLDKFPAYLLPLIPYVNQLRSIIEKYNLSLEEAALNYVGSKDYIDAMLIGVDSLTHLNSNLNAINSVTPLDFIKEVDEIKVSVSELLNPAKWNR